jgi:hypothetical protein
MPEHVPGIRLAYSRREKTREILHHSYGINFGFFDKPHFTHPELTNALTKLAKGRGLVELTAFHGTKTISIDMNPYPTEQHREALKQNGIASAIEYIVLKHFSTKVDKNYTITHSTTGDRPDHQLPKTGRYGGMTVREELAALESYLRNKGLLKYIKSTRIALDDLFDFNRD